MPIRYELREPIIWFETRGDVDYDAGLGVLQAGIEAARQRTPGRSWDVLFDIRESSERRSADELREIAQVLAGHLPAISRYCAVVAGDAFHFGLGRMFSAYSEPEGVEVHVFREQAAAEQWLAQHRADVADDAPEASPTQRVRED